MFANTQMMGMDFGFPDMGPAPAPAPASSGGNSGFGLPGLGALGGLFGAPLMGLASFLPSIDPSIAGGMIPGLPQLGGMMPQLPGSFLPKIDPSVAF